LEAFLGVAVLLTAKFLAYSLYLRTLARRWNAPVNAYAWAIARIGAGLAIGAGVLWLARAGEGDGFVSAYVIALGAARVGVWALILRLAFRNRAGVARLAIGTGLGVALSYAIDIPVFFGWITAIGGIC
jgi:hypothetical protein